MARGKYEFSDRTKEAARRKWHAENPGNEHEEIEIDHIVSVREAKQRGIPPVIASSMINAQGMRKKDNREKSDKDADPKFVEYLLSLMARLF